MRKLKNLAFRLIPSEVYIKHCNFYTEEVTGQDLFISALKSHALDTKTTRINLICYENPPATYLPTASNEKIISYNYFSDPCGWKNSGAPKSDLTSFISNNASYLSETTIFIDSLSHLTNYHGYHTTYRVLSALNKLAQKIICLAHVDLFSPEQVKDLHFLATAFISLQQTKGKRNLEEKAAEVVYRKSGGKVVKQTEAFLMSDELTISSRVGLTKAPAPQSGKEDIEDLTTFKLGLQMSEKERKAKDELILPYVKSRAGEIIYQPETDEFEDDPDDDLDI